MRAFQCQVFKKKSSIKQRPGKHPSALPRMGENQKIKSKELTILSCAAPWWSKSRAAKESADDAMKMTE
jgi:hypothetical protein